jgi:hypothetical protein
LILLGLPVVEAIGYLPDTPNYIGSIRYFWSVFSHYQITAVIRHLPFSSGILNIFVMCGLSPMVQRPANNSGLDPLAGVGMPVWIDYSARMARMVMDGKVALTDSMNWTGGAAHNFESDNLVGSPTIAAASAHHFHQRLAISSPCTQRDDCGIGPRWRTRTRNYRRDETGTTRRFGRAGSRERDLPDG